MSLSKDKKFKNLLSKKSGLLKLSLRSVFKNMYDSTEWVSIHYLQSQLCFTEISLAIVSQDLPTDLPRETSAI